MVVRSGEKGSVSTSGQMKKNDGDVIIGNGEEGHAATFGQVKNEGSSMVASDFEKGSATVFGQSGLGNEKDETEAGTNDSCSKKEENIGQGSPIGSEKPKIKGSDTNSNQASDLFASQTVSNTACDHTSTDVEKSGLAMPIPAKPIKLENASAVSQPLSEAAPSDPVAVVDEGIYPTVVAKKCGKTVTLLKLDPGSAHFIRSQPPHEVILYHCLHIHSVFFISLFLGGIIYKKKEEVEFVKLFMRQLK